MGKLWLSVAVVFYHRHSLIDVSAQEFCEAGHTFILKHTVGGGHDSD